MIYNITSDKPPEVVSIDDILKLSAEMGKRAESIPIRLDVSESFLETLRTLPRVKGDMAFRSLEGLPVQINPDLPAIEEGPDGAREVHWRFVYREGR